MSEEKVMLPLEKFGIEVEIYNLDEEDVDCRLTFQVDIKEEDAARFGEAVIMDETEKVMRDILNSGGCLNSKWSEEEDG